MDKLNELSTGAKIVLGSAIAFLIVSFFSWFDAGGVIGEAAEEAGIDTGVTMWHGVGWIAGLLAIGLIVWQVIRLANIELEIGVTPAMVTAALAVLLLIFTFIRWIDTPDGFDRTFWAWLGLALAIIVAVGAWMNMQAAGEGVQTVRDRFGTRSDTTTTTTTQPPTTPPPSETTPSAPTPPEAPPPADADRTP
jgi:hypothetical protein